MRSDVIKKGATRAPHRSLLKALGITDEEMKKPFIGVAQAANEIIPGHIHLGGQGRTGKVNDRSSRADKNLPAWNRSGIKDQCKMVN